MRKGREEIWGKGQEDMKMLMYEVSGAKKNAVVEGNNMLRGYQLSV